MKCLKIPNTPAFKEITNINDALISNLISSTKNKNEFRIFKI